MVPLTKHLKGYNRQTFASDANAGLVVGMVTIPQAIAYALLAGVPPEAGLYACLLPMILYSLFGSSKHLVVGPVAIAALLIVSTVSEHAPKFSSEYVHITQIVCIEVALIFMVLKTLKLGALTNLISHPVLTGFVNGAVLLIIISQLSTIVGVNGISGLSASDSLSHLINETSDFKMLSLTLGLGAIVFLICFKWIIKRKTARDPENAPNQREHLIIGMGPIILVSTSILFVYSFDGATTLQTVGHIPNGLPSLLIPDVDLQIWLSMLPGSFIIALVTYIESYSIATTLANKEQKTIDSQQELFALSAANLGAGLTGAYPVAGSFTRSSVNYFSGAKTPMSSLICALLIIISLLFFTELFSLLPLAILGAIVIVSAMSLFDFSVVQQNWEIHKSDKVSELITFLSVLLIGVEIGLMVGIFLSISFFLQQASRPQITQVGRIPKTEFFRSIERYEAETLPDSLFVRVDENIFFANANNIEAKLLELMGQAEFPRHLIIVCSAINRIDSTGLQMLSRLNRRLEESDSFLHLSDLKGTLLNKLDHNDLESRLSGKIFQTANAGMIQLKEDRQS